VKKLVLVLAAWAVGFASPGGAYPLDGWEHSHIDRLLAYDRAQDFLLSRGTLKPGSLRGIESIELTLGDRPDFELPASDPYLVRKLQAELGGDARGYGIALLDLTDPAAPNYAELQGSRAQNPGSVGKIAVALGLFQAMAAAWPDPADRERVLRTATITADPFMGQDSHTVPLWRPGEEIMRKRPLQEGDTASLWTWLDWMLSVSSNAAAAMVQKHLMLVGHFGSAYPVPDVEAERYFAETPNVQLGRDFRALMLDPLGRNGIDKDRFRQGSVFSRYGKAQVPGTNSLATPRELMKLLVAMEAGRLVDRWSSLELKRLLYLTDRRIRYASSPTLVDSAVYFKSGSLYKCKPEAGFACEKYHGNVWNFMNSIAIVESDEGGRNLRYIAVVLSNVLRKNSAVEHQTLAGRIHDVVRSLHPAPEPPPVSVPSSAEPTLAPDTGAGAASE
jgi:hypothetical protein